MKRAPETATENNGEVKKVELDPNEMTSIVNGNRIVVLKKGITSVTITER